MTLGQIRIKLKQGCRVFVPVSAGGNLATKMEITRHQFLLRTQSKPDSTEITALLNGQRIEIGG